MKKGRAYRAWLAHELPFILERAIRERVAKHRPEMPIFVAKMSIGALPPVMTSAAAATFVAGKKGRHILESLRGSSDPIIAGTVPGAVKEAARRGASTTRTAPAAKPTRPRIPRRKKSPTDIA